ncbi:hypothetical protein ABVT39_026956 [Epinephelus coioides]
MITGRRGFQLTAALKTDLQTGQMLQVDESLTPAENLNHTSTKRGVRPHLSLHLKQATTTTCKIQFVNQRHDSKQ